MRVLSPGKLRGRLGLIMCLEEFGYEGQAEGHLTATIKGWSVAKIKRMGVVGVKVLLFYHPESARVSTRSSWPGTSSSSRSS